jgi:hypothetical protein
MGKVHIKDNQTLVLARGQEQSYKSSRLQQ